MMEYFNATPSSSRVMFDEEDNNGLVLCDKYLPVEVLIEIFLYADCKTLLSCQLVCKRWKMLINNIWHKKTVRTLGRPFPRNDEMPWSVYYLACAKKPYERNLVKNHSSAEGMNHWIVKSICHDGDGGWEVEEPPVNMPELPQTEPLFKDREICFGSRYYNDRQYCTELQVIVMTDEGIHPYILDTYQPPIVVSEWFGCSCYCARMYQLKVKLFDTDEKLIDEFQFSHDLLEEYEDEYWLEVSHVFENYGRGLRRIIFEHSGVFGAFCLDGCGIKMAGACVYVKMP